VLPGERRLWLGLKQIARPDLTVRHQPASSPDLLLIIPFWRVMGSGLVPRS
jgi:hypothetical protein